MKEWVLVALVMSCAAQAAAGAEVHWLRDPALSPDGRSIAFRSNGDLHVAPVRGGDARLLRDSPAYETAPLWLSDGKAIAYAANLNGNFDVYVANSDGTGEPRRLTWHSRDEIPVAVSPDGRRVLMRSGRLELSPSLAAYPMTFDSGEEALRPRQWMGLFSLPIEGGMPEPLVEPVSLEGSWDAGGRLIFSVRPGSDLVYRKHERSPAASNIWLREADGRSFRQLSRFEGNDTTPMVNQADGLIYFLSERNGSLNVWRMPYEGDAGAEQVTHHQRYPVSGLSISADGTLAYSYRGELYAGKPDRGFQKIAIRLPRRSLQGGSAEPRDLRVSLTSVLLSPNGHDAIVCARGEVYAIERASQRWRKLLSSYAGAKSSPSLSADGRTLLVVRDRGDASELLLTRLPDTAATWLEEGEPRSSVLATTQQDVILAAALSPAGDRAVYSTGDQLRRISLPDGSIDVVLTREEGLSEEVQPLVWHPQANVLALPWRNLKRDSLEVAILDLEDGEVLNASQSGFAEWAPSWSADGRSLLWLGDRYGLRAFGAGGGTSDVQVLFLDPKSFLAYKDGSGLIAPPADKGDLRRWLATIRKNSVLVPDRRVRLTPDSVSLAGVALAPSGRFLLRLQRSRQSGSEVWRQPLPDGEAVRIATLPGVERPSAYFRSSASIQIGSDESVALALVDGSAHWLDLLTGSLTKVALSGVPAGDAPTEQRWLFEHIARAVNRVFFRPDRLTEMDWTGYVTENRRFLPAVSEPRDFAELVQAWLGELDASHTYFELTPDRIDERTGSLGVIFDTAHAGPGFRLLEILRDSPLAKAAPEAQPGDIVTEIDGKPIPGHADPAQYLADTVDRATRVTLRSDSGVERDLEIRPIDSRREAELFYRRWVDWHRAQTEMLSHRKLGYVHVPAMAEEPFRTVIEEVLGRYVDAQGIVLDLRYNQGGWMHEPLLSFFSTGTAFALRAYGVVHATEPAIRAGRPIVTLVNEATYSNGFETARLLREQGVSRLVGSALAGTGLGWNTDPLPYWEYGYGVAHDASETPEGEDWEGVTLFPDIAVAADRAVLREGRDVQLEAAVQDLLASLEKSRRASLEDQKWTNQ